MASTKRASVKVDTRRLWALADADGQFVADSSGVLLWKHKRQVPDSDDERAVQVDVTVTPVRSS
jgi:hypothetical protein